MDAKLAEEGSFIGQLRKTPELLSGIFTEVMRQLYYADNGLHLENKWTWEEEPTDPKGKIWINAESVWNDLEPDHRPAIYVALSDIAYRSQTGLQRSKSGMDLSEAEYHYTRSGAGTVQYVHVGRTQGEAQAIISNTLDLLDAFSDPIREDFCFKTLNVAAVRPPRVTDKEPRERFRGEVIVQYSFDDSWSLKLESPKLKRVVLDAGLRLSEVLGLESNVM